MLAAKIRALFDGRFAASVDDVRAVVLPALRHRVLLNFEGEAEGIKTDQVRRRHPQGPPRGQAESTRAGPTERPRTDPSGTCLRRPRVLAVALPQGERRRRRDDDLFDDEFQRKLEYLALVSRRVFAGRLRAERRTKKSGSGVEFADHRDYQPGDDFRYLDWSAYQRFEKLLVRLYEEEEDLAIYFILDTSALDGASAAASKLTYAKKVVRRARVRGPRQPRPREHRHDDRPR